MRGELADAVVGILVLAWLLRRQLTVRPVRERLTSALVLTAIGAIQTIGSLPQHVIGSATVAVTLASVVVGLVLSAARAYSMRLSVLDGTLTRQGTVVTVVLWLLSVASHIALGHANPAHSGAPSLLAYIGLSLLAQQLVVRMRAGQYRRRW
ncbi:uncharacterized protein RMCC_6082 [Mycolicibacterium canariasense]|uniref:Transmembrane protein n=1 Tax=Mycolicibacterium canariasense TaxID=228230 RepID=A0A100WIU2_MYCCR|nr:hypothetical protein [Mycolicibacterium canariasense]MCV7208139.1 hypothetical protein [Mycolicibacterium canariasense]ORV09517.1 hypothetical protein AWB94_09700 [Mycolicibacterium canariasense]GAS99117.1 uncharacterized protein RMCC_6082 [Mycolicibacterium canariasense]